MVITKVDFWHQKKKRKKERKVVLDIFSVLDKTTAAVGPLSQKIRVGPEGGNDACNGGNIQKFNYQKKREN